MNVVLRAEAQGDELGVVKCRERVSEHWQFGRVAELLKSFTMRPDVRLHRGPAWVAGLGCVTKLIRQAPQRDDDLEIGRPCALVGRTTGGKGRQIGTVSVGDLDALSLE